MSKNQRRRGFVRPQVVQATTPPAERPVAWQAALERFEAAEDTLDKTCEAIGLYSGKNVMAPADVHDAYAAARDGLISTPAPNGSALAYKLAVVIHAFTPLEGDLRKDEERRWVFDHGDEGDRAALALYFDALALSGVQATVSAPPIPKGSQWQSALERLRELTPKEGEDASPSYLDARLCVLRESAPDWRGVCEKVNLLEEITGAVYLRCKADTAPPWAKTLSALAHGANVLQLVAPHHRNRTQAVEVGTLAERLALEFSEDPTGYRNYAVNPAGLLEIASAVATIQADVRVLVGQIDSVAPALAIDAAFFPGKREQAREIIDEYRALGGTLQAMQRDGQWYLGTGFPETPSARSEEIETALVAYGRLSRAVMALLREEQGQ